VDLVSSQEKQKQALAELGSKDEELVVIKVELSTMQEKLKATVEDVSTNLVSRFSTLKKSYLRPHG
jgi:hypothetical protein